MNEPTSVELTVTTAALEQAVGLLAIHFSVFFHLETWRALSGECYRREAGLPARSIMLARERLDELPPNVKAVLPGDTATPGRHLTDLEPAQLAQPPMERQFREHWRQ